MTTTAASTDKMGKTVDVTVKTPAGHAHPFSFKDDTRVSKVIHEATKYFVGAGRLDDGEYGLALIRDGRTTELAPQLVSTTTTSSMARRSPSTR